MVNFINGNLALFYWFDQLHLFLYLMYIFFFFIKLQFELTFSLCNVYYYFFFIFISWKIAFNEFVVGFLRHSLLLLVFCVVCVYSLSTLHIFIYNRFKSITLIKNIITHIINIDTIFFFMLLNWIFLKVIKLIIGFVFSYILNDTIYK